MNVSLRLFEPSASEACFQLKAALCNIWDHFQIVINTSVFPTSRLGCALYSSVVRIRTPQENVGKDLTAHHQQYHKMAPVSIFTKI